VTARGQLLVPCRGRGGLGQRGPAVGLCWEPCQGWVLRGAAMAALVGLGSILHWVADAGSAVAGCIPARPGLAWLQVDIVEQQSSFLHFLTNVCAIVGGVWAISGVVDGALYQGQQLIRKKQQLGKFT